MVSTTMGVDYRHAKPPFYNTLVESTEAKICAESGPIWDRICHSVTSRLFSMRTSLTSRRFGRLYRSIIEHVQQNIDTEKPANERGLVEDMLAMGSDVEYVLERIKEMFIHVLFKMGHEITMAIWLLQTNPAEWNKFRCAVKAAGSPTNWRDMVAVPYARWIMNESMFPFCTCCLTNSCSSTTLSCISHA